MLEENEHILFTPSKDMRRRVGKNTWRSPERLSSSGTEGLTQICTRGSMQKQDTGSRSPQPAQHGCFLCGQDYTHTGSRDYHRTMSDGRSSMGRWMRTEEQQPGHFSHSSHLIGTATCQPFVDPSDSNAALIYFLSLAVKLRRPEFKYTAHT